MINKVVNLIKEQPFVVPSLLLKNYRKLNITDKELIILIYLINSDTSFNPKQISKDLNFDLSETMEIINTLMEKTLLKIDVINKKITEEVINLDELYNKLSFIVINDEENEDKKDIFTMFEKEFGRTLSPIDYEIISVWQKDYNEQLIQLALKEAVFNGVNNLRYIDKILYEWNKKGIKTSEDVENEKKKFQNKKSDKELFDYDWLNEKDN